MVVVMRLVGCEFGMTLLTVLCVMVPMMVLKLTGGVGVLWCVCVLFDQTK